MLSWADLQTYLNSMTHEFLDSHRAQGDSSWDYLIWSPLIWEAKGLRRESEFVHMDRSGELET